jgi:hypothetical protein
LLKIAQNKEVSSSAASGKSFKNDGTYIYFCTVDLILFLTFFIVNTSKLMIPGLVIFLQ